MSMYDDRWSPDIHALLHISPFNTRASTSARCSIAQHRQPGRHRQRPQQHKKSASKFNRKTKHGSLLVRPPANKTNPDANDAADKLPRACPRPAGYVLHLLLVALYTSTYDDRAPPDAHASLRISPSNMRASTSAKRSIVMHRQPTHHG
jgi:hypothetical protein